MLNYNLLIDHLRNNKALYRPQFDSVLPTIKVTPTGGDPIEFLLENMVWTTKDDIGTVMHICKVETMDRSATPLDAGSGYAIAVWVPGEEKRLFVIWEDEELMHFLGLPERSK